MTDLDPIKELLDKITPGKIGVVTHLYCGTETWALRQKSGDTYKGFLVAEGFARRADASFFVLSLEAMPSLIKEIETLRHDLERTVKTHSELATENERLRAALEKIRMRSAQHREDTDTDRKRDLFHVYSTATRALKGAANE